MRRALSGVPLWLLLSSTAAFAETTSLSPNGCPLSGCTLDHLTVTNATVLSGTISGAGVTALFASPPAIGGTAAAAGAFTTLSASSTVSGAGITALFASPPAIGGTAAAAGTFTTLVATAGTLTGVTINDNSSAPTSVIIGTGAGAAVSGSSSHVVAVGDGAGGAFTGTGLTAVGYFACHASVASSPLGPSTCFGQNAGTNDNGTTGNLYAGSFAGNANVSGSESVYLGTNAGILATGNSNTIVGFNAWFTATSGGSTTIVAQDGGKFFATTSHDDTLIGQSSGKSASGAAAMNYVTAVGSATFLNIYGSGDIGSVAIGAFSMQGAGSNAATGGTQTVAVGMNTGLNYTTSTQDTLVGYQAGIAITGGGQRVFIGPNAGSSITTGGDLIIISTYRSNQGIPGVSSGTSDAICIGNHIGCGTNDLFIGLGAGAATSENSNQNTGVGTNSLTAVTSGNRNVGLGPGACGAVNTGSDNLCLGYVAGGTTLQSGSANILIANNVYPADTPASNTSNWFNIGNALRGTLIKPTIGSGFGTSPSVPSGTSSAVFTIDVGTGGVATSGVISFASAAPTGWTCDVTDSSSVATITTASVPTSTTSVTLTGYSRTTGLATAWAASDILVAKCLPY